MNQVVLTLERTVPTRWFYWFSAVKKVINTYQEIILVLDEGKKDRAESISIKAQMVQESFIFLLHAMELILGTNYCLSQQLQSRDLDLSAAVYLIQSTSEELIKIRCDESYDEILTKAKSLANRCSGILIPKKGKSLFRQRLAENVVLTTVGQSCSRDTKLKRIYFGVLGSIIIEFDRRFLENEGLYYAFLSFKKYHEAFLRREELEPLIQQYKHLLDIDLLTLQLPLAKSYLIKTNWGDTVISFLESLRVLPTAYAEVVKLLQIFATLPITTAGNERFF